MHSPKKAPTILGLKSLSLALVLEGLLFIGLSRVFGPYKEAASLQRNLAWVPKDQLAQLAEEPDIPDTKEPKLPLTTFPAPLPLQKLPPLPEEPLAPLPSEEKQQQARLLPWRPDPLDSTSLTKPFPPRTVHKDTHHPPLKEKKSNFTPPSKAQTKTLSPVEGWNSPPPYPPHAISLGQEGSVLLELEINSKGFVTKTRILKGSGSPLLDLVCRKCLGQWRYDGGPGKVREQVIFKLARGNGAVEIEGIHEDPSFPKPRSRK